MTDGSSGANPANQGAGNEPSAGAGTVTGENPNPNPGTGEGSAPKEGEKSSGEGVGAKASAKAEKAGAKAAAKAASATSSSEAEVDDRHRVVCELMLIDQNKKPIPLRDTIIDGIAFATVKIGGVEVHISERIPREEAERYREIAGFRIFDGGDEYDRVIEDALDKARAATPGAGLSSAERGYKQQLEEQQQINLGLASELRSKDDAIRSQADEIHRLKGELARLREETGR